MEELSSELNRAQRELDPKEDLSAYEGEWVLLRGGYMVGHDDELSRLVAGHERRDGDVVLLVPEGADDIWVM